MTLGKRIRGLRDTYGWTHEQLEEHSGVSKERIVIIESGRERPQAGDIRAIAKAFSLTLADIISGLDKPVWSPKETPAPIVPPWAPPAPLMEEPVTLGPPVPDPPSLGIAPLDIAPPQVFVESGQQETAVIHVATAVSENEGQVNVVDRQVTTHVFTAPPARVGAQFQVSFQVSNDQWMGVRVWTERPCATEDVETTRELVISETRAALDHQYQRLLHEAAAAYRIEQPGLKIV